MLAHNFIGCIPKQPLRARIPAQDGSVERYYEYRVLASARYQQVEPLITFFARERAVIRYHRIPTFPQEEECACSWQTPKRRSRLVKRSPTPSRWSNKKDARPLVEQ